MKPEELNQKSRDIIKAVVAGQSCEEILARDHTLTYHDVFHAAAEISTSQWKKNPAKGSRHAWVKSAEPDQPARQHRID